MLPKFLQSETVLYASVEIVLASHCACGVVLARHVDGWDGTPLDCTEAQRRAGFHTFLTAPATGRMLDSLIQDNADTDARILAERDEELEAEWRAEREGDACGPNCGWCGRCS